MQPLFAQRGQPHANRECSEEAFRSSCRLSNYVQELAFPFEEGLKYVKNRNDRISPHGMEELREEDFHFRMVYILEEGRCNGEQTQPL